MQNDLSSDVTTPLPLPSQRLAWKAILSDDYSSLMELCKKGVIVNGQYPLLSEAIRRKCPMKMIELLLLEKINPNRRVGDEIPALIEAVSQGSVKLTNLLLNNGANPNIVGYLGRTPLMIAAYEGRLALVGRLLAANANVNLRDVHGRTAWGLAKISIRPRYYQNQISKILAQAGARL